MRLDKFLKVARIIKRRTLAKEVCDSGRIKINGNTAKAGSLVKPGDILEIGFGERQSRYQIMQVAENVRADAAKDMYKELN
ncbi:MAG: RNA-binding S4 domain-containing protein [Peptococcaceae bacterium]